MADLPPAIEAAFEHDDPQDVFDALMPVMVRRRQRGAVLPLPAR